MASKSIKRLTIMTKKRPKNWKEWEIENTECLKQIKKLQKKGHSHHCACRQVWGDGECECHLYRKGYDPFAWIKNLFKQRN